MDSFRFLPPSIVALTTSVLLINLATAAPSREYPYSILRGYWAGVVRV